MQKYILFFLAAPFAVNAQPLNTTQTSLVELVQKAKTHQERVEQALESEANKGTGFDPCRASLLDLQAQYDKWFVANASKIESIATSIQAELTRANQKLAELQKMTVVINAVSGQNSDVTLSLNQLIEYFTNLNDRLKDIQESRVSLLLDSQENPRLNPLKVSHSQILEAVKLLTQNLNASLREQQTQYAVGFTNLGRSFTFEFKLVVPIEGRELPFTISLLHGAQNLTLTHSEIWSRMSRENFQIGGFPLDGRIRYRQMRDQIMKKQCIEDLKVTFVSTLYGFPYATFEQASEGQSFATATHWVPLPSPGLFTLHQAVINPAGDIFALSTLNEKGLSQILKYSFATSTWIPYAVGSIDKIEFSPDGGLYGRNTIQNIYRYSADNKLWSMISAHRNAKNFWIMRDGATWLLTKEGHIGTPGATHIQSQESVPTQCLQVAGNTERLYALSNSHQIHVRSAQRVWDPQPLPQAPSKIIQIASPRADTLLGLGEDGNLYSLTDSFWSLVTESNSPQKQIVQFYISENLSITGVDKNGQAYVLKEKQQ
jgi:hypothetical protein